MSEKHTVELGDIQKTMLLPLWGRAMETRKAKPLLYDMKAVEIINMIDYDFSRISENISPLTQLAWIGRSLLTDKLVKKFIDKHPNAVIVDLGCGMDTNFERVDNGILRWYDLDLSDVIELRRKFFRESDRRKFISGSLLDGNWLNQLQIEDNIIFIAAGVLYYFQENQVRDIINKIAEGFPGSEFIFDVASPLGVRIANKMVIKNSGMDERSFLKWGLRKINDFRDWDNRIVSVSRFSFFKDFRSRLDFKTWYGTHLSDLLNIMYMVHLKISE